MDGRFRKVAIVGVEGSGKTVMLAGLGELCRDRDAEGYFLAPKDYQTDAYVRERISCMREGRWPSATAADVLQSVVWTLRRSADRRRRPEDVCEVSCLDFAGEVYRHAFVAPPTERRSAALSRQVEALWDYVAHADALVVLVNLGDVITYGLKDKRVAENAWVTNGLLEEALKERAGRRIPRAVLVLSQADRYADTIRRCGGARATLRKYLPSLMASYDWLDVLEARTVDRTTLTDEGEEIPAPDFSLEGLRPVVDWIIRGGEAPSGDGNGGGQAPDAAFGEPPPPKSSPSFLAWLIIVIVGVALLLLKVLWTGSDPREPPHRGHPMHRGPSAHRGPADF